MSEGEGRVMVDVTRPYPDSPGPLMYLPAPGDSVLVRGDSYGLPGEHWAQVIRHVYDPPGFRDSFDESLPLPAPKRQGVVVRLRALPSAAWEGDIDALFWVRELLSHREQDGGLPFPPIGYEVLVDCTAYGVQGMRWCLVESHALGSAAVYPIKVRVPGRGQGQFRPREVEAERAPAVD